MTNKKKKKSIKKVPTKINEKNKQEKSNNKSKINNIKKKPVNSSNDNNNSSESTKGKKKKGYSNYEHPESDKLNDIPVKVGSVISGKLSFYEKLPEGVEDHTRESVVMIKANDGSLCVIYIHGLYDKKGNSRKHKADKGIWLEIIKNGQRVYIDLDLHCVDAKGNPLKQGAELKNTGIIIDEKTMEQIRKHIFSYNRRKSHGIRKAITRNKDIEAKKNKV